MDLLQQILEDKQEELSRTKSARPLKDLQSRIQSMPRPLGLRRALTGSGFGVIAEIKRKSPSMADMIPANVAEAPQAYKESEWVKAVSILTDSKYFGMSIEELERLKGVIGKPVLRKDFIFDEYQIWEARAFGADAILLMASVLEKDRLLPLFQLASELGLDVLFECHTLDEIKSIPQNATIYGINSRKFKTSRRSLRYAVSRLLGKLKLVELFGIKDFSTDIEVFRRLAPALPRTAVKVAESGLTPKTILEIRELGFDCALIGTALLKSPLGVRRTLAQFEDALRGVPAQAKAAGHSPSVPAV